LACVAEPLANREPKDCPVDDPRIIRNLMRHCWITHPNTRVDDTRHQYLLCSRHTQNMYIIRL
jgi:hypothetical protein